MGCFDYECECGGTKCYHQGGQYHSSTVIIEVPLSDNTTVFLKGFYEEYGYVVVNGHHFYPKQFEDIAEEGSFKAKRIWTESEYDYDEEDRVTRNCYGEDYVDELTPTILKKCIKFILEENR